MNDPRSAATGKGQQWGMTADGIRAFSCTLCRPQKVRARRFSIESLPGGAATVSGAAGIDTRFTACDSGCSGQWANNQTELGAL